MQIVKTCGVIIHNIFMLRKLLFITKFYKALYILKNMICKIFLLFFFLFEHYI